MADKKLLFTEEEWGAAAADVAREMDDYAPRFCTAISKHLGDHGEPWGTGSFLKLDGRIFILTNEHVVNVRSPTQLLLYQLRDQEDVHPILGDHLCFRWPLDTALLPVEPSAWDTSGHGSKAITTDMIAVTHEPVPTELLMFAGFSGERSKFHFNTLITRWTSSTAREVPLPKGERLKPQFHFALDYRPDSAMNVVGTHGLPRPPGFSGSAVWNTRFVESRMAGEPWTPEWARVTGLVWGWPSSIGCIVATRSKYVRSFLLFASELLSNGASL